MIRDGLSRRALLGGLGAAWAGSAFSQGGCRDGYGGVNPRCPLPVDQATAPIKELFEPSGWKTVALESFTIDVVDYKKEAAFYIALMGWKLRSDDGKQAILDIGDWGSAIFKAAPAEQTSALVDGFGFAIEPWNAKTVEAELRKRDLSPVADKDRKSV